MNEKDLRIGNYICTNDKADFVGTVYSISDDVVTIHKKISGVQYQEYSMHPGHFVPIPLTEDWLLKFGFEKVSTGKMWFDDKVVYESKCKRLQLNWAYKNTYDAYIKIDDFPASACTGNGNPLKSVHSLQNLYYAIFSTELQ